MIRNSIFSGNVRLLSFLTLFFLVSCGSDDVDAPKTDSIANTSSQHTTDPMAKMWNDSAINYYRFSREPDSVKALKAAWLLDKATLVDPDYYQAYFNKLACLNASSQFDRGLEAAKQLTRLHPKNIDHILQLAEMLDLTGDSINAQRKYQEALNDYETFLKAPGVDGTTLEMTKVSRGICMIMLGKEKEGKEIILDLYINHTKASTKGMIEPLVGKGRNEILNGLRHHDLMSKNDSTNTTQ